jgi:hypothetical protein
MRLQDKIQIFSSAPVIDTDGFGTPTDILLAEVHANVILKDIEKGSNDAEFTKNTISVTFRVIPSVPIIDTANFIVWNGERYQIRSVNKSRGLIYTVTADMSKGSQ